MINHFKFFIFLKLSMWPQYIKILITPIIFCLIQLEVKASEQPKPDCDSLKNKKSVIRKSDDFLKGTWKFYPCISAIGSDHGKGEMYALHIGFGYFFQDKLSVNIDILGTHIRSGIDDNGVAAGMDILLRKHFHQSHDDLWSIYFDTGGGLQQQSTNFSGSRHFNFRLMTGVGGTLKIFNNIRIISGVRYLHISDAGIRGGGGGFDGVMFYSGGSFPF